MIDAAAVMTRFAELIDEQHEALTALDQRAGDGDFGDNLRGGLQLVLAELALPPSQRRGGDNGFAVAGEVFLDEVGGTSGPLLGLLLQAMGADPDALAEGIGRGLAAIQRVGEAEPGDRTMIDALAPAAQALAEGGSLVAAADAAYKGTRQTCEMRGRSGRASYLGDRVLGAPDPGAAGIALLLLALAEVDDSEGAAVGLSWSPGDLVGSDLPRS